MKIKLFTHTDLDGIGCAIVGKIAFEDIDVTYCNYDDVNEKIKDFVINQEYKNFDCVYITDISVNKEVAELIDKTRPDNFKNGFTLNEMFQLLDHHKTAEWLNEYYWCEVSDITEKTNEKTSGTRMFFHNIYDEYIREKIINNDQLYNILSFVENVNRYDTWLWSTKYKDDEPKKWNDLLYITGREDFIKNVIYKINNNHDFYLSDFELDILRYKQAEIDSYIEKKSKQIITKEIQGYNAGVIFAEQYHSELGNVLATNNPDLDFIVIINPSQAVSYRGIKDTIDLGVIAKIYSGGGHPRASGSPIADSVKEQIINIIFGLE